MVSRVWTFYELAKPRMVTLFVAVGLAAYVVEGGAGLEGLFVLTVVGVLASSGTNMITAYIDRDIDTVMKRTKNRAIPSGRIAPQDALMAGIGFGCASLLISQVYFGLVVALLILGAILGVAVLYNLILKRRTPLSTIIGAVPGSFPVIVGGAAATGGVGTGSILLAGALFWWQLPHFWLLSLRFHEDYERAKIPTMVSAYGLKTAKRLILSATAIMVLYNLLIVRRFGLPFLFGTLLASAIAIAAVFDVQVKTHVRSRHTNAYIFYICLVFLSALLSA